MKLLGRKFFYAVLCAALTTMLVGVQPVYAAAITVNSNLDNTTGGNGACTLREAINNANSNSDTTSGDCSPGAGSDTINFSGGFIITLAGSQLPQITSPIEIDGNGPASTIIEANSIANAATYRVFEVTAAGNLTLEDLTVRYGVCAGACSTSPTSGGGIYNAGTLILTNSNFLGNNANFGGAIHSGPGSMTITNTHFTSNSSTVSSGGAIFQSQTITTVTGGSFTANTSASWGGAITSDNGATLNVFDGLFFGNTATADGGGIASTTASTLNVTNTMFKGNASTRGGGIYSDIGPVMVTSSTFENNSVVSSFGEGGAISAQNLTISNSTFNNNTATATNFGIGASGGAINIAAGKLTVTNSTFYANQGIGGPCSGSPTESGVGGVSIQGGSGHSISNSTFSDNTFTGGSSCGPVPYTAGALYTSAALSLNNTILANSNYADCIDFNNTVTGSNNLIETNGNSGFGWDCGGVTVTADPQLGGLTNNGGLTKTMALTGPPAVDTGAGCLATDQRGVSRPQGAGCDIGAFELDSTYPTVVSDSLVASYASGAGPASFTVNFSENVDDPSGNTTTDDVTNPNNYIVVERGANNTFDTSACQGGVTPDDIQVTVTGVTYNSSLFVATVNFAAAVPNGTYRLFVCGTTSIVDPANNALNNGATDYTFDFTVGGAAAPAAASALPATGFAPGRVTKLPAQPADSAYTALGDIWLEIPSQNIKVDIVGVPKPEKGTWDVTWLGNNAGWLNGTAFPTWQGNSVITGHVTDSNGLPGPFADIKSLRYGDQIIVHLYGQSYIFEIRSTRMLRPGINAYAFQHLEDGAYLTLITCQGFDEQTDSYRFRRVVRAVLIRVE